MRVFLNKEGREIIKKGIDLAVGAIKTTLGAGGRNSIIYSGGIVYSTRDGVSVARSIVLDGDLNIGASIIRNSTEQQLQDCGDATTCTAIITQKIIEYGFDAIDKSIDVTELKRGLDKGVEIVCDEIDRMSVQVGDDNEKIKNIATISANNDNELGTLIAGAFKEIGNEGTLFIEESKSVNTSVRVENGYKIDKGYMSPLFCNPETMEAELINPYILFYDGKIDKFSQVKPLLDEMMKLQKRELLIICDNVEGEALQTLALNRIKGVLNIVCVNAPHFGDRKTYTMNDMSAITSGTYITSEKGIKDFGIAHCGTAEKVLVTNSDTTIIGAKCNKEDIEKISNQIDALISQSDSDMEILMLKQRKAKVKGRLAVISVGGNSEIEMKEKKDRVEDAVKSTEAAISEGVVIGGGVALLRCVSVLENITGISEKQMVGIGILKKSLTEPLFQILENAGIENKEQVIESILKMEPQFGFNVKTGAIENLFESGVIDAAKVIKFAVKNGTSVAGTIIMSESLVC